MDLEADAPLKLGLLLDGLSFTDMYLMISFLENALFGIFSFSFWSENIAYISYIFPDHIFLCTRHVQDAVSL